MCGGVKIARPRRRSASNECLRFCAHIKVQGERRLNWGFSLVVSLPFIDSNEQAVDKNIIFVRKYGIFVNKAQKNTFEERLTKKVKVSTK